jgi:hypothetical protein
MDFNFGDFLKQSKDSCKTKADFIKKINDEENLISDIKDGPNFLERKVYLKRLSNAKFCTENRVIKEKDTLNDELLSLLDGLK